MLLLNLVFKKRKENYNPRTQFLFDFLSNKHKDNIYLLIIYKLVETLKGRMIVYKEHRPGIKINQLALPSLAQQLECQPTDQRVVGLIPVKGMYLGFDSVPTPDWGHAGGSQLMCVSLTLMFLSLSLSPSHSHSI
uniref:Uncharacterized protein n=1 Tax=Molossus molossus TaxID=27622 RepID=A0A7J8DTZ8_MOLMO|nr:hypothetical protein HJG59_009158 [Molossus molossus]